MGEPCRAWLGPVLSLAFTGAAASGLLAADQLGNIHGFTQDHWHSDHGLPQNSITAITQARDGYLWLGTYDGLVRFDGLQFRVFNVHNAPSLGSSRILSLLEDRSGTLWIGTEGRGLTRYRDGVFTNFYEPSSLAGVVHEIHEGAQGDLWLVTSRRSVVRFRAERFLPVHAGSELPEEPTGCLHGDGAGRVWLGTSRGVAEFANGGFELHTIDVPVRDPRVTLIQADGRGGLWLGTPRDVVRYVDGVFTRVGPAGFPPAPPTSLHAQPEGGLWVGTDGAGAYRVDHERVEHLTSQDGPGDDRALGFVGARDGGLWIRSGRGLSRLKDGRLQRFTPAEGLVGENIRSLLEDREGSLWIGTLGRGLARLKPASVNVIGQREGLGGDEVLAVLEGRDGKMWLSSSGAGLQFLQGGRVVPFSSHLPLGHVWSLWEDADGTLWLGTWGSGLVRVRGRETKAFTLADGLASSVVLALLRDSRGDLWVGTWDGGAQRLAKDGRFETFTTREGLPSHAVRMIHEDRAGAIWLATDGGVARIEGRRVTTYTRKDGLPGDALRSIHEDPEGGLWFGTYGSGLARYKHGRMVPIRPEDGLCDPIASQILEDDKGFLWISSNRGVFRVSRKELDGFADGRGTSITCRRFGREDGMRSAECNGGFRPAGIRARDGRLWFPTMAGVAIIDPGSLFVNQHPPPVVIEQVLVNRQPTALGAVPRLGPGVRDMEFHYTALSFLTSARLTFQYRLEGFDRAWVEAGTRRVAYYTNVPPGAYTFRVRAANEDGVRDEGGAAFRLRVAPRFYETSWFAALGAVALGLGGWTAHRLRVRHLRARHRELAHRVREALARIRVLRGLLPICAWCKKIRDDEGYWTEVDVFVREHTEADFTHGICPECRARVVRSSESAGPEVA